ncbi:MAG TPA: DUF6794 domain-containing protein [Saprospiraceae bacterium]|nr:DUF6794 domain-containing protein [Saprospiraceae bacterium]
MMKNNRFLLLILLLAGSTISHAQKEEPEGGPPSSESEFDKQYKENIRKEVLNGVYIPKNLEDAMLELDKRISEEARAKFKDIPEDSVCMVMHLRLGQWMIHNWGFYGGSRLSHYLRSAGVTFPDDMADFLILAYHRRQNGRPIEIKQLATEFKEKRKKEYQDKMKKGKVIHEEVRKRN